MQIQAVKGSIALDDAHSVRSILSAYEEITLIEGATQNSSIVHFRLYNNEFVLFCPDRADPSSKASIYILNESSFNYPHIMLNGVEVNDNLGLPKGKYRSICLFEAGSMIFSMQSYEEKIIDAIERLISLLSLTPLEIEKELQKEFLFYWDSAASGEVIDLYLGSYEKFTMLDYYQNQKNVRCVKPDLQLNDIDEYKSGRRVWQKRIDIISFYIPILDNRGIIPPNKDHHWKISEITELIFGKKISHISTSTLQEMKDTIVEKSTIIIVFGLTTDIATISFTVKIKCRNSNQKSLLQKILEDATEVEELHSIRRDYFSLNKNIGNESDMLGKKTLLVGAGSLGSYVANELVRNGMNNLTIYDGDILSIENIMRWSYGGLWVGHNKANVLKIALESFHPEVHITAYDHNIDRKLLISELENAGLIIFTVGSSDTQLKLNEVLKENGCNVPVLYVWLEAGGEYSHILKIDYNEDGCFECLYTDYNGEILNNKANIESAQAVEISTIHNGCGGTRVAYGTSVLLRTVSALLNVMREIYKGEMKSNCLVNISSGETNNLGSDFSEKECKCCGKADPI